MPAVINYLTKIVFGEDALDSLGDELTQLGVSVPLLVTDKGLVQSGLIEHVRQAISRPSPLPIYDETPPNPTEDAVEAVRNPRLVRRARPRGQKRQLTIDLHAVGVDDRPAEFLRDVERERRFSRCCRAEDDEGGGGRHLETRP